MNQNVSYNTSNDSIGGNIKNWLTVLKLAKFTKSNLTKSKNTKAKKWDFANANSFATDYSTFRAKEVFIYL